MYFEKIEEFGNLEMSYISDISGGYILRNKHILTNLELNRFTQFILEKCVYGTPIFKLGSGGNRILVISGIHGNELSPQIANVKLFILHSIRFTEINHEQRKGFQFNGLKPFGTYQ